MIRKSSRRRPEVETMETLVLLSGASIVGHHGAAALVAHEPQATNPIVLTGEAKGTYKKDAGAGAPIRFKGKGSIEPLGKLTDIDGSVQLTPSGYLGSATLKHIKGAVFMNVSTSGPNSPLIYTITGGSGKFKDATGSGTGTFTLEPGGSPDLGKFRITF